MRARFYLVKKLVDSGGAAPIYINIHHRSHRLRYYTGERIKPKNGTVNNREPNPIISDMHPSMTCWTRWRRNPKPSNAMPELPALIARLST
jgi:hypothetical protein